MLKFKGKKANPNKLFSMRTNPSSSNFSSQKMDKKLKDLKNLSKGSVFFPFTQPTVKSPTGRLIKGNMPNMNKVMKNMFGDKDRDGVNNMFDCKPKNPKKQDWDYKQAAKDVQHIVYMSPLKYLQATGTEPTDKFLQTYSDYDEQDEMPIKKLQEYIESKDVKVRMPFLGGPDSTALGPGSGREHEGRHRAFAAHLAGHEEIPVRMPPPRSWRRQEVFDEFFEKRFPHGDERYKEEWKGRFKKDFPQERMDLNTLRAYKESLSSRGLIRPQVAIAAHDDNDGDGIINAEDCDPNDPNKQDKQIHLYPRNKYQTPGSTAAFVVLDKEQHKEKIYFDNMKQFNESNIPAVANIISHEEIHHEIKDQQSSNPEQAIYDSQRLDNISTPFVLSKSGEIENPKTGALPVGGEEAQYETIIKETGVPWWATKNVKVEQIVKKKHEETKKQYRW